MHKQLRGNVAGTVALVALAREKPRRTIARALARAGWAVTVAATAQEALEAARAEQPDLIVVGTSLGTLEDGTHVAQALSLCGPESFRPRLVLVVAQHDAASKALAKAANATRVVVVPVEEPSVETAPQMASGRHGPRNEAAARELWIVDDNQAIRLLVRHAFERECWQVREFENLTSAQEATAALGASVKDSPVAIVLDIHLPDGNGLDSVRRFAATGAAVVVVSNLAGPEQVERAFAAGAADLVSKPFDLRSLVARVNRAIALPPSCVVATDVVPAELPVVVGHEASVVITHWG